MQRYTVSYDGPNAADRAVADAQMFLGDRAFDALVTALRRGGFPTLEGFASVMALAGVSGFPVDAFFERYAPQQ